jgi:hypothetical protein
MSRPAFRSARATRAWLGVLAVLAFAGPARAIGIADTNPVFFIGGGEFGFSEAALTAAGKTPIASATPSDTFITAGNVIYSPALAITQVLGPAHQNPQAAYQAPAVGCQPGDICQTPSNPFIADSTWTVTNLSGHDIENAYLVFTLVDLSGGYPDIPVAMDGNMVEFLEYVAGGQTYYFGLVGLGPLGDGVVDGEGVESSQSTQFTLRYIVGGDMVFDGATQVIPPLGVYGLERPAIPVPEPGTALLIALGFVGLAMAKRLQA